MQIIPNILTLSNLFCGCCAIICVLNGYFMDSFAFFCAAFIFDIADGPVARKLGVSSELGKQLDSLADMVSFGVLPGVIMYSLLIKAMNFDLEHWMKYLKPQALNYVAAPAFLISVFAGYRLAKFNIDKRQSDVFLGLATPANTAFVVGLMLIYVTNIHDLGQYLMNVYVLYAIIPLLCFLQVAEIPMMKFRMTSYGFKGNEMRYIFLALTLVSLFIFKEGVFAFGVIIYIVSSLINNLVFSKNN